MLHWGFFFFLQKCKCLLCAITTSYCLLTQSLIHTLYPFWRPLHFLLVPIMQEQAVILPGSQAGAEGSTVWSHGAPSLPSLHSSNFSFIQFFSLILQLSYVIYFFLIALTFVSFYLPSRATQIQAVGRKKRATSWRRGHSNKQINFSRRWQDVPQNEGYFHMSWRWFEERKTRALSLQAVFISCCGSRMWKLYLKKTALSYSRARQELLMEMCNKRGERKKRLTFKVLLQ